MKKFFVTLLVGLAALGAAWAQEGTQEAAVRVVHLVPNGPNVDITLNGEAALQGLAAGTVSGYVSVPAGQYDVEVIAAGGTVAAEPGAQAETPAGDVGAVGTEVDAVGAELGEAGNELEQAVTGGAAEVEQAVTGTATGLEQAVTGGVAGVAGQDLQAVQAALPTLFATIRETINAQDFELAQDQIEEAQQNLETLQVGAATDDSVQGVQETLQVAQEALDTPEAAPAALEALDQAEQQYGQIDVASIEGALGAAGGVTGAQPVVTDTEAGVDQAGADQAVVQESLAAMPTLFATIRETINLQDYQLAQDQIEEAQQLVQNVGGVGTEAVLPTLELIQEQLQTAQEALDEPDPTVALAAIDEAEQTFGQVEGELGAATGTTTGGAAGVEQGQAIATATLTLEPGQYYTVVAAQTQEALEGRINIGAQPGGAEINVTGPNGFAESFVGSRQLEALTPGNYIIAGTLVGYQSAQQQVEAQAGETLAADLVLEPLTQEQIAETPGEATGGATGGAAQAGFPESPALVQLLVFQDSLDLPPAGQALVRVIHASPDAPAVNVIAQIAQEGDAVTGGAVTGGAAEAGALELTLDPAETVITVTGPDGYAEEFTGSQTLEGLVPGEYVIAATLEGYQPTETTIQVAPGEVLPVEVILEAEPESSTPQGNAFVNVLTQYTALLGLQLDQELGGYVSGAVTALEADDLETAQQDLRAALLAVQAQLEGAEGDTLQALQSTETSIQDAITALDNDDTAGALTTLQTVQGAQTGGAAVEVEVTGGATGGVTGGEQTGGAQTGGAQTGGAPADPAQVEGSVETALAALEAGDVTGAQNELRAVLLVVQGQIETAEGDQLATLQTTEASVQEALTALDTEDTELALTTLQDAQAGVVVTDAATGGAVAEAAPAEAQTQVQGQTLVSNLSTGNASSYVAVPAGTYQLQVQTAEGGNVVIDIPNSALEGGVVYTFYAFGSPTQGTLAINVSVDALVAQQIR